MAYRDKEKERAKQRAWYHANKEKRRETKRRNRERVRQWWASYKQTLRCGRCPESDPACITFHHRDRSEKEITLAVAVAKEWGIERLQKELAKCDILCANCHFKLHWSQRHA